MRFSVAVVAFMPEGCVRCRYISVAWHVFCQMRHHQGALRFSAEVVALVPNAYVVQVYLSHLARERL